ncbi:protein phosphatase PHLPP-like protein [Agrilus planipennis]|uniref:Protein phosphatase PHLPP-like protein n=1 Tax=Agrilus planipennis TaxID=224129 RepID=A0A7F5R321_AGRPL|nr:protein phosphatase PHLPP-like protein [Agrilus planipennis]
MFLNIPPKKPARSSAFLRSNFTSIGSDGIEMDSLENVEEVVFTSPRQTESPKKDKMCLNLDGICDKLADCDYFFEDVNIPDSSLRTLMDLQILTLRHNNMQIFPTSILKITSLVRLDLSNNWLLTLPPEINCLINLEELFLDHNVLSILPPTIWDLKLLRVLRVAHNRLALPPDKFIEMRSFVLTGIDKLTDNSEKTKTITSLNLRGNRLKGNIILGNYGNLTELDVSENSIEILDLSAVENLKVLHCSKNSIVQLMLHGRTLISILAGNNRLQTLTVVHPPYGLKHLDISYNNLDALPEWILNCRDLRSLFASNNNLKSLPDHIFCNEMSQLSTIQLAYNQLYSLPTIQRKMPINELFLQNNNLSILPENLFTCFNRLKVLNVSNNRLYELPTTDEVLYIEKLFLTANCLCDRTFERLCSHLRNLKVFHVAYNNLTSMPDNFPAIWTEIEEIVISGNRIVRLPDDIGRLQHLAILRLHSNLLQSCPKLSTLNNLRVLDLAHNHLDKIDLTTLIPSNLKFLDLSCNTKLHVDSQQFNTYRTQRPMSLVDVSGKNRTTLPLTPSSFCEADLTQSNWSVGFSETSGSKQKLYVSQVRLPAFCNTEGLFGIFDAENYTEIPIHVDKIVPRILLEERTIKETANDYMKYTILSTHKVLRDKGHKNGMNAILVHVYKEKGTNENLLIGGIKRYTMKIASVGEIRVVLGKQSGPVQILPQKQIRRAQLGHNHLHNLIPDPEVTDINLEESDEYMIIANKNLWDVISPETAIKEVSYQQNVILAAKRLQDLAQSYGAEENLSIIVVKFNLVNSDVDILMRELRQTIRKNKYQSESGFSTASTCQPGCCCEALSNACTTCLEKIPLPPPIITNEDRSSPSGQSDQACSDCNSSAKFFVQQFQRHNDIKSAKGSSSGERRSYRGVAKAVRSRKDEDKNKDDSDSALSEEQFKCWEYMLEQNTQMLFDKELNSLGKGASKSRAFPSKLLPISRSSPHLAEAGTNSGMSFLSKQFGSSRSYNPLLSKSTSKLYQDKKLIGGPHAAYFGSLQRLMPYNLEYDFAVMHERGLADSVDLDRMQQYWGVTTTEL